MQQQFIRAHIQFKSGHKKLQCLKSTWDKRSTESPKSCEEHEDQEAHWEPVRSIFDHGGHLQNSRSSSLQEGKF